MLDKLNALINAGKSLSPSFKLDFTDLKKVCRTGLFVGASSFVVYVMSNLSVMDFDGKDNDTGINLIIVTLLTFVLDGVNRYLKNNTEEKEVKE